MLTQRGPAKTTSVVGSKAKAAAPVGPRATAKRMTFKDKHALDTLPVRIASLEAEIAKFNRQLGDPGLYAKDPVKFAAISQALVESQAALTAAEEQWLELEMQREAIGA